MIVYITLINTVIFFVLIKTLKKLKDKKEGKYLVANVPCKINHNKIVKFFEIFSVIAMTMFGLILLAYPFVFFFTGMSMGAPTYDSTNLLNKYISTTIFIYPVIYSFILVLFILFKVFKFPIIFRVLLSIIPLFCAYPYYALFCIFGLLAKKDVVTLTVVVAIIFSIILLLHFSEKRKRKS